MTGAGLKATNISWAAPRGPVLVHATSFTVEPGRVLCILGANGAGKSTLLRLLYRYYRPSTGQVRVGGDDLWQISARAAARRIAAVLQEQPTDFSLNVRQIVDLGRTPFRDGLSVGCARDAEMVEMALDRMGLSGFAARMFGTLSGGERQRVMVARALAQEPRILILDEPTNHLDIRHQLEVLEMIRSLGMTIVTSLHDLNFAVRYADEVLVLKNGHTLDFGPARDVLTESLLSRAFDVGTRNQTLQPSGQCHFTFHLNQGDFSS
ncbi:MAG TPA: ABC transporter ATP-binding protein [Devosia sp.]|nr:ABC transporter ATP-binding protein [Devosia sp.]